MPITFPPDRFYGAELSAMCVPDLLGTQGTFLLFTTRPSAGARSRRAACACRSRSTAIGSRRPCRARRTRSSTATRRSTLPLRISTRSRDADRADAEIGGTRVELDAGQLSDWVTLRFRAVPGVDVTGLTRLLVTEMGEHFSLYMSPINIDPETPAMPISHPSYYATYLAKRIGPFSTLGLAEDTWALNEGVTDDGDVSAADLRHRSRARGDVLRRARSAATRQPGVRVRRDRPHPAHVLALHRPGASGRRRARRRASTATPSASSISTTTRWSAACMERLRDGDVLMVISDHGFSSFRRGVNLNSWLLREGYLDAQRRRRRHAPNGCATSTGRRREPTASGSPACS